RSPRAARPSPSSSGWWWPRWRRCFCFLTRAGVFGRSLRFGFLRVAMAARSRRRGPLLPPGERRGEVACPLDRALEHGDGRDGIPLDAEPVVGAVEQQELTRQAACDLAEARDPLDEEAEEPRRVDVRRHVAVRLPAGA